MYSHFLFFFSSLVAFI